MKTSAEYKQLVSPDNLTELKGLADELTKSLRMLYEETAVSLEWRSAADFSDPAPRRRSFAGRWRIPVNRREAGQRPPEGVYPYPSPAPSAAPLS